MQLLESLQLPQKYTNANAFSIAEYLIFKPDRRREKPLLWAIVNHGRSFISRLHWNKAFESDEFQVQILTRNHKIFNQLLKKHVQMVHYRLHSYLCNSWLAGSFFDIQSDFVFQTKYRFIKLWAKYRKFITRIAFSKTWKPFFMQQNLKRRQISTRKHFLSTIVSV